MDQVPYNKCISLLFRVTPFILKILIFRDYPSQHNECLEISFTSRLLLFPQPLSFSQLFQATCLPLRDTSSFLKKKKLRMHTHNIC